MGLKSIEGKLASLERRLERSLGKQEEFADWEERTEQIVETKVHELKTLTYLLLLISSALFALVLGMVLNAIGVRF